tara:strand:+ start:988 stop:1278 length:291 start_codon:yes stop_codon:yes gene_type:complete
MKDLDLYLGEAVDNIRADRDKAKEFLVQLEELVLESDDTYNLKQLGLVAAKYLETLQRSNEQLVKVAALLQKNSNNNDGLSEKDKDELFDMIKEVA